MERIADKLVALALGLVAAASWETEAGAATVAAALAAVLVSTVTELGSKTGWWRLLPLAACAACLLWPPAVVWLPLIVCDLAPLGWAWSAAAAVALVGCLGRAPSGSLAEVALFGGIVGMLAWRTARSQALVESYRDRRDQLSAASQRLRELNADLAHRAELEVRLATADERSRIAREIHDNAGHLLVRAVLQAEALAAADPALAGRLAPLAATLDTAMDTIRQSVHDLAAEALDLEAHLASLGDGTGLRVTVDYQAGPLPPEVTRAFIAIAREAVANTLRHSDARTTRIAVADRPGFHQLTMHDDGSTASAASPRVPPGPAPGPARAGAHAGTGPSADAGRGLGLAAIEDRARALGGVSRVSWDRGFRVFVSVPRRAGGQAAADPERTRATA